MAPLKRLVELTCAGEKTPIWCSKNVCFCSDMNKADYPVSDQMLSRKAVAARWQTSVATVKRREKAGLIKAIRFNQRLLRYRLSEIAAFEAAAGGRCHSN